MAILYNSNYDLTIPQSDVCYQVSLVANTDLSFTLPGNETNKYSLRFTYTSTSNVFVCFNSAVTLPGSGTVGTQQYNEFRAGDDGSQRYGQGGDVIHFKTPDASAFVGVSVRAIS